MPKSVALVPTQLNPDDWPPAIKKHFFLRVRERELSVQDMQQIRQWSLQRPHAQPNEEWYKELSNFTLVGQGAYPKSVLMPGMKANGRKLAKPKLLRKNCWVTPT